jgi:hypothetical protein
VRGWRIARQTPATLAEQAQQYNSVIRGWCVDYGGFYQTALRQMSRYIDGKLEQWAICKYQTLSRRKRRSVEWLPRWRRKARCYFSTGLFSRTRLDNKGCVNRESLCTVS